MDKIEFNEWVLQLDREATRRGYTAIEGGGADRCDCDQCNNYVAARATHLPGSLRSVLDMLGADETKDAEVYALAPVGEDMVLYGGWFAFVGQLDSGPDLGALGDQVERAPDIPANASRQYVDIGGGVAIGFASECDLTPPEFLGHKVAMIEFTAEIPWVLDGPRLA